MSNPTCSECRFWVEEGQYLMPRGQCRRFPPKDGKFGPEWPTVYPSSWCGEWQLAEPNDAE